MLIPRRTVRTSQPQQFTGLSDKFLAHLPEWVSTANHSILVGSAPTVGLSSLRDLITGRLATSVDSNNSLYRVISPHGIGSRNSALSEVGSASHLGPVGVLHGATEYTLAITGIFTSSDVSRQKLNFRVDYQTTLDIFSQTSSSITWGSDGAFAWNGTSQQTLSGLADGDRYTLIAVVRQGEARLFHNGRFAGTKSGSSGWSINTSADACNILEDATSYTQSFACRKAFSDDYAIAVSANPWQIFEDEEDYLFIPEAGGGGSVSLIVADALHGHAVDSPSFSMATYLAVAESLHTQAADNLTLSTTGSANLAIQEAAHAHVSDGVALTTRWLLIVADALHTHAADNLTMGVTGATTLTVADATSVHTADSVALSVIAFLAIADAVSQHAADNLTLDTSNATFLTVQDAAHAHSSDGTGLSLNTWLAIVEAAHSHTADAPVLSAATALVVAESLHAQFADVVVLSFPSSGSCPTASEIAAAVLAALNATTGTRTVGQHLQIQTAVLAGNETGAGTTHVTFTDGTAVVEADVPLPGAIGNRTNVTISV